MKVRKFMGCMLAAAAVGSFFSVSAAARSEIPADEIPEYLSSGSHTFGLCGDFTQWSVMNDVMLADPDGDGIFVGVIRNLSEGEHSFKVRADSSWDDNWGAYNDEMDATFNSRDDIIITLESDSDVLVVFDATERDPMLWKATTYITNELTPSKYGIVGTMTRWGETDPDYPMYEITDGWFVGVATDCPFGEQQFKVRADSAWDESYGVYEADYDRTNNSQTNCSAEIPGSGDIIVELDTRGEDDQVWPVSFAVIDSENNVYDQQFTGRDKPSLPSYDYSSQPEEDPSAPEISETEDSETSEEESMVSTVSSEEESTVQSGSSVAASSASSAPSSSSTASLAAPTVNNTTSTVVSNNSTTVQTDVPKTGDGVAAVAMIVLSTTALGVFTLLYKKKN